ncbi:response regulator [Roseiconus lacunae]|uniref:Response regulator n=1 Tax=Roseiconus lacunae TaxID=2605694 RepID=A0ABT7PP74_9BACT|nr:response regulator [Roseiconus lacunae]MCD0460183.1 response regulator [Roseiconus lacunae]MDM4018307.1 response regulator [Roseiconus lacunae]WRQ53631.1 response regulator [Stieleria sp. HD01]
MASVILVDDDSHLLSGLRRNLREQPYELFTANSTETAIQMFQRHPFDVAVVDQHMGGRLGTELIAWISLHFPNTVRIMLTGSTDMWVAQEAVNNGGVFRFLTKPCLSLDLALAIHEGLEMQSEV